MEEMLYKFIDESIREHEEMRASIYDFQTTNELLFKERNYLLIELRFREPLVVNHDEPVESNEVNTNDQPQKSNEPVIQPSNDECYDIDDLDETINAQAQELLENDEPNSFLARGLEKSIDQSDLKSYESVESKANDDSDSDEPIRHIESINKPYLGAQETAKPVEVEREHLYSASANEIDAKKPELKDLPHPLEYAYLHGDKFFPIIISSKLSKKEKILLLHVLEKRKGAISWTMSNIKGIDVVKNKIVKMLDSELIYPILDSSWVSRIHVVPKKGGMIVGLNDNNELVASRIVIGWRVCIDYRKLNDATRKEHFPLPFIDQMLDRLCGNEYYYFLDGFSGFFWILITPGDLEKATFTCPYGTFAYRRMPKQNAKPRLIRSALLLQGFDINIKDKRGAENLAADHLSRLENPNLGTFMKEEIADEFLDEHLMILKAELNNDEPWYAD
nr:reverse transcriptase domain-containing protein [Tanacetum cinerariifolium]